MWPFQRKKPVIRKRVRWTCNGCVPGYCTEILPEGVTPVCPVGETPEFKREGEEY